MNITLSTLSSTFQGACVKRLSSTESDPQTSHGHEFQGIKSFVEIFGKPTGGEKITIPTKYIYLSDDEQFKAEGTLTFYDSRWNKPNRAAEYRLYYSNNSITDAMFADDCLIIAKDYENKAYVIIAKHENAIMSDLLWLFGLTQDIKSGKFTRIPPEKLNHKTIPAELTQLAKFIGIKTQENDDYLIEMQELFGFNFPATTQFSAFARSKSNYKHSSDGNADDVLYDWYNTEYHLFNIFEKAILDKRIQEGFTPDNFIATAYSFIQRRYSRAGHSLENHLSQLFEERGIIYSHTPITEGKSKPDFLFPGIDQYKNLAFPADFLHMLAVKTTCKDRWRQVLVEADRIPNKHLLTLQGAISIHQTNEMLKHNLQLVIPRILHDSYTLTQQQNLMTVEDFIILLQNTQSNIAASVI